MSENRFPPEFHPLTIETNQAVLAAADSFGCRIFLVGGYIRDALLGRVKLGVAKDLDYTIIGGTAVDFARFLAERLDGNFVLLDQSNDTARVVLENETQVDLAGCLDHSLDTDIRRRDLTINALLWDPANPEFIRDDVGGMSDLASRTVRVVSEQSLIEDPLRLMRVFRFSASLGFQIDPTTQELVAKHSAKLKSIAAERISYELFAIMESTRSAETIKQMSESGLLEIVFPEMLDMHRVPPNSYHHLGLFDHSLEVLRQTEQSLSDMPEWAQETFKSPIAQTLTKYGGTKLSALLHDVGKPDTWAVLEDGRHTFIGHDKLGAELCTHISKRLKWSKPVERFVSNLVLWHLRPGALFHQGLPTDRAVHRFYRTVGDEVPQLVLLALGDFRGTCGPGLQNNRKILENQLGELLARYVVFNEGRMHTPRLLDGSDVMTILGLQPGPMIGQLLEELEEAQGLKEVLNRQQAEVFVKDRFRQKYSS